MNRIKLKDLLRELQLKEAPVMDTPPPMVKFVMPPQDHAYGKAASDGAGKPYTRPNIDFSGFSAISGIKSDKLANALAIAEKKGDLVQKAADIIAPLENNKSLRWVKINHQSHKNYDKATDSWYPIPDRGGWSIGYGHRSKDVPDQPMTDAIAKRTLRNDIIQKIAYAKRLIKNFDRFPDSVKLGIINSLYRGERSPKAFAELNKEHPDFLAAANAYITTKDNTAVERMKLNAALIASGGMPGNLSKNIK